MISVSSVVDRGESRIGAEGVRSGRGRRFVIGRLDRDPARPVAFFAIARVSTFGLTDQRFVSLQCSIAQALLTRSP
jgi:hypothetical protein